MTLFIESLKHACCCSCKTWFAMWITWLKMLLYLYAIIARVFKFWFLREKRSILRRKRRTVWLIQSPQCMWRTWAENNLWLRNEDFAHVQIVTGCFPLSASMFLFTNFNASERMLRCRSCDVTRMPQAFYPPCNVACDSSVDDKFDIVFIQ